MKRIIPIVFLILLGLSLSLKAQTPIEITSTQGFTVSILLTPVGVQVNNPCPNGYNYDIIFDYDISFTGNNIPAGGLYTLQGNAGCGTSTLFLPLENGGGTGQTSTTGNASQSDCGVPATLDALLCDELILTISGPGIPFQDVDASGFLPVDFVSFTAAKEGKAVRLNWSTASEAGSDFFEVQRAEAGVAWTVLDRVYSYGNGDSNEPQDYTFLDEDVVAGDLYYRLRQVDLDGSFTYSPLVSTSFTATDAFEVFPNPATDWVSVTTSEDIRLLDLTGRLLLSGTDAVRSGENRVSLNVSDLPAGVYLLKSGSETKRLIIR